MIWETKEAGSWSRKLKIENDGDDSLSIEHKEDTYVLQVHGPANKQHT